MKLPVKASPAGEPAGLGVQKAGLERGLDGVGRAGAAPGEVGLARVSHERGRVPERAIRYEIVLRTSCPMPTTSDALLLHVSDPASPLIRLHT